MEEKSLMLLYSLVSFEIVAVQRGIFLLRGTRRTIRHQQNPMPGVERKRKSLGQSQIQFRQSGTSFDVAFCLVFQGWLG